MNTSVKYSLLTTPNYTGMNGCGYHWGRRDSFSSEANQYKNDVQNYQNKINNWQNGTEQQSLNTLIGEYERLDDEIKKLQSQKEDLRVELEVWKNDPATQYAKKVLKENLLVPKAMNSWLSNAWESIGGDELVGCSRAKRAEREAEANKNKWLHKKAEKEDEYNQLKNRYKNEKQRYEAQVESKQKAKKQLLIDIEALQTEIGKERIKYETLLQNRENARLRKIIEDKQKENQAKENQAQPNNEPKKKGISGTTLFVGTMVLVGGYILLKDKKPTTVIKAKKVKM